MQNKIYTVVGATGSGKTPFIIGGDFEEGLAKIFLKKGMSTLVIDEIDHHKYSHVPILKPSQYGLLCSKPGIYRTLVSLQNIRQVVKDIAFNKQVWNTLLVFEDPKKWLSNNWIAGDRLELTLIGNSKQQNVDIVFMFWSWSQIPPALFDMTKYFVVLKTASGPAIRKRELGDCYNDCLQAHELVSKGKFVNKKPYYIVETGI